MVRASPHNSQMSKRELERSQTVEFGGGVHLVYGAEPDPPAFLSSWSGAVVVAIPPSPSKSELAGVVP